MSALTDQATTSHGELSRDSLDRVRLTVDSIQSLAYNYPQADAFTFSFVDYLLLLYFRRVELSIWSVRTRELLFTSLPANDRMLLRDAPASVYSELNTPCTHVWIDQSAGTELQFRIDVLGQTSESDLLSAVFEELEGDQAGYRVTLTRIASYLNASVGRKAAKKPLFDAPESAETIGVEEVRLEPDDVDAYLEAFRRRFNRIAEEFTTLGSPITIDCGEVNVNGNERLASNLFAVVRYVPFAGYRRRVHSRAGGQSPEYSYTAKILLSEAQISWIGPELAERMVQPLGDCGRFVADTPFMSGLVDCGDDEGAARVDPASSRDLPGESEPDRARHAAESEVYARLRRGSDDELKIVYFPVHVGGIPWLALYSFSHVGDRPLHNYRVYRQLLPAFGQQLRQAAREAYFECLAHQVAEVTADLTEWTEETTSLLNERWTKAAYVYPFRCPSLFVVKDKRPFDATRDVAIGHTHLRISTRDPLFAAHERLPFQELKAEQVLTSCLQAFDGFRRRLDAKEQEQIAVQRQLTDAVYGLGHSFKNRATPARRALQELTLRLGKLPLDAATKDVLLRDAKGSLGLVGATGRLGKLLDFLRSTVGANTTPDPHKADWYDVTPYQLASRASALANDMIASARGGSEKRLVLHVEPTASGATIGRWLAKRTVLYYHDFYEETVFEVLQNIINHAAADADAVVHATLHQEVDQDGNSWLVFSNTCTSDGPARFGRVFSGDEWQTWTRFRTSGGLSYSEMVLERTGAGLLRARYQKRDNKLQIGLRLEGLLGEGAL